MTDAIYVGYDDRESVAFDVLKHSLLRRTKAKIDVIPLKHMALRKAGLFTRPWVTGADGQPGCVVDGRPFSTQFSHSRFLVPHLARLAGYSRAVFVDCDFLFLDDVMKLIECAPPTLPVSCCKHSFIPKDTHKMDGVVQQPYPRKLWSSLMVFRPQHPLLDDLTPDYVNQVDGRALHGFEWVADDQIGGVDLAWNWLPGLSAGKPKAVHFTSGMPWMDGHQNDDYAPHWFVELAHMHHGSLFT